MYTDVELLIKVAALLAELIVAVVPVCEDAWLTIVEDKVGGIVAVFSVELPMVWLVPVCIAEDALVLVSCDVSVCKDD